MANPITPVRQGESHDFDFAVIGSDTTSGWIATLVVKEFPSGTVFITRVVDATTNVTWDGFLTSTETAALAADTTYRLIGILTNSGTDEAQQDISRFAITASWGG